MIQNQQQFEKLYQDYKDKRTKIEIKLKEEEDKKIENIKKITSQYNTQVTNFNNCVAGK